VNFNCCGFDTELPHLDLPGPFYAIAKSAILDKTV
jgi:hypothetical protein